MSAPPPGTSTSTDVKSALAPQPPLPRLLALKSVWIADDLPPDVVLRLESAARAMGATLAPEPLAATYIITNPPYASAAWFRTYTAHVATLEPDEPRPALRGYHWLLASLGAGRLLRAAEVPRSPVPALQVRERESGDGEARARRPARVYVSINVERRETESASDAHAAVVRALEAHGAVESPRRDTADVLVLNLETNAGRTYAAEKREGQRVVEREWVDEVVRGSQEEGEGRGQARTEARPREGQRDDGAARPAVQPIVDRRGRDGHRNGQDDGNDSFGEDDTGLRVNANGKRPRHTRAEFTQEDDDLLARYLCNTDPHAKGWKGQSFYERMLKDPVPRHLAFAKRHTVQSWRERVRKRHDYFQGLVQRYRALGVDARLTTAQERRERAERARGQAGAEEEALGAGTERNGQAPAGGSGRRERERQREAVPQQDRAEGSAHAERRAKKPRTSDVFESRPIEPTIHQQQMQAAAEAKRQAADLAAARRAAQLAQRKVSGAVQAAQFGGESEGEGERSDAGPAAELRGAKGGREHDSKTSSETKLIKMEGRQPLIADDDDDEEDPLDDGADSPVAADPGPQLGLQHVAGQIQQSAQAGPSRQRFFPEPSLDMDSDDEETERDLLRAAGRGLGSVLASVDDDELAETQAVALQFLAGLGNEEPSALRASSVSVSASGKRRKARASDPAPRMQRLAEEDDEDDLRDLPALHKSRAVAARKSTGGLLAGPAATYGDKGTDDDDESEREIDNRERIPVNISGMLTINSIQVSPRGMAQRSGRRSATPLGNVRLSQRSSQPPSSVDSKRSHKQVQRPHTVAFPSRQAPAEKVAAAAKPHDPGRQLAAMAQEYGLDFKTILSIVEDHMKSNPGKVDPEQVKALLRQKKARQQS